MKFSTSRPYADPEAAARKLLEIANATGLAALGLRNDGKRQSKRPVIG